MSTLNMYVSKAYAEHPLGLWSFDNVNENQVSQQAGDEVATISGDWDFGIPMVYGSRNSVRLFPGSSITYPSFGMFTDDGKNNSYTADMWLRIDARTNEPQRIWGNSNSGLWVDDAYLTLVVDNKNKSYAIENWYRPMLVSVIYTPTGSHLLINGEEVISIQHDASSLNLGNEDLSFVCPDFVRLYEVDCFAIYPYSVPEIPLRRRFVWGQGVSNMTINPSIYDTTTAYLNYPFADYANNFSYPEQADWDSGYSNGLLDNGLSLQAPTYQLPEIVDYNNTLDDLYNKQTKSNAFTFNVDSGITPKAYMRFPNMHQLTTPIQGFYAEFYATDTTSLQPLVMFKKNNTNEKVEIYLQDGEVKYDLNGETFYSLAVSGRFFVGLDLNFVIKKANYNNILVGNFFKSIGDIEIWLMGDGSNTFTGDLRRFGFIDSFVMSRQELTENYLNGIVRQSSVWEKFVSYTLMPYDEHGEYSLDVSAAAYWEDTIPLALLGKSYDEERKLSFLQINYGYDGDYEILQDGENSYYNFDNCELKAYVGFDYLKQYPEKSLWDHDNFVPFSTDKIVRAQSGSFATTAYEINSGAVVYIPSSIDFWETKMSVYFDIQAKAVNRRRFSIKNLSVASQATVEEENTINTEQGTKLYSSGAFAITKENVPYLYLAKDSGIEPLDSPVRMPFNENNVPDYYINMVNFWVKPNLINANTQEFFTIKVEGSEVGLMFKSNNNEEATFTFGTTDTDQSQMARVYKNGVLVDLMNGEDLILKDNQWAMIGIEFVSLFPVFAYVGNVNMYPGAVYQNIQVTHIPLDVLMSKPDFRIWDEVTVGGSYQDWYTLVTDWYNLWIEKSGYEFPIDTTTLYELFIGRNSFAVDDNSLLGFVAVGSGFTLNADWEVFNRRPA